MLEDDLEGAGRKVSGCLQHVLGAKFPKASTRSDRNTKLDFGFSEYANILRGIYSVRFNGNTSNHGGGCATSEV